MKNLVTEKLLRQVKSQAKVTAAELTFLGDYYQRLSGQDYSTDNALPLLNFARRHRQLAEYREPEQVLIDIYNPPHAERDETEGNSVLSIVTDDQPFIINSLIIRLNALRKAPLRVNYPNFLVQREQCKLVQLQRFKSTPTAPEQTEGLLVEIFIQFEIDFTPPAEHQALKTALLEIFHATKVVVDDWPDMRAAALTLADEMQTQQSAAHFVEYAELLRWMKQDHFAFLGYCEVVAIDSAEGSHYRIDVDSLRGILRVLWQTSRGSAPARQAILDTLPPMPDDRVLRMIFTQSPRRSEIHRDNFLDCLVIDRSATKHTDMATRTERKTTRRLSVLLGFLAGSVAHLSIQSIPHLCNKAAFVLRQSNLRHDGHAYKELRKTLENLPRELLFQMHRADLYTLNMSLLNLQGRRKTRAYLLRNVCGHFYTCLVYLPRELFNSTLRQRIQNYLQQYLAAREVTFDVYFSESMLTRIHFLAHLEVGSEAKPVDTRTIEADIQALARDWNEQLFEAIRQQADVHKAQQCMAVYHDAFPLNYREDFNIAAALSDLAVFDALPPGQITALLSANQTAHQHADNRASLKLYSAGQAIALSAILPLLENMGIYVLGERPYCIATKTGQLYWLHDFDVARKDAAKINLGLAPRLQQLLVQTWLGANENDGFNQLTLLAGLNWREVSLVRAYFRYLKQIGLLYSQSYIVEALKNNPDLVINVNAWFDARFNIAYHRHDVSRQTKALEKQLEQVTTLDEDRIFRAWFDAMRATLRTNYYQRHNNQHKPYISLKFKADAIADIPPPAPAYEIFVCSPRVEGVHLRGGKIARGGLRWSERAEDYRTEVLGLAKAQRVKNAVIVPLGSKGGFIAKQLANLAGAGTPALQQEVIECYQIFVRGLLDLTDNLVAKKVVAPPELIRHDADDTYLVVAADKGTATFSDVANDLAAQYQFWLGDAFASGGSVGYDHKKMGITARGAWESVKRHFRELGKDIQTTDFTVVGIGDMSGDVFGNGMLLSEHIRLVAAFNHRHIFIDPTPNAKTAYQERKRLFELPRASWDDYTRRLISSGGGVFERQAKSITLSRQAQKALSASKERYTPNELLRLILTAEVELLWNGGIGTYVKAAFETHAQAQDRNNDGVRVDATQLRCQVIGEGGNLGMTQNARIEFAQRGGLCYTDAIDNSAGVDTSDHEVNIKILLNQAQQSGHLTLTQRKRLLGKMQAQIATLVLHNNYVQTQIISLEAAFSQRLMPQHSRAIQLLEQKGLLQRELEYLPSELSIQKRLEQQQWLTRPELATLLSYSKIDLSQLLLDSDFADDPRLQSVLSDYFPSQLATKFAAQLPKHRLRRELICTQVTNDLVGTMGSSVHLRMSELTGADAPQVAKAYLAAKEILSVKPLLESIRAYDNAVPACLQMELHYHIISALSTALGWLLRQPPTAIATTLEKYQPSYKKLAAEWAKTTAALPAAQKPDWHRWVKQGIAPQIADHLQQLTALSDALPIIDIAKRQKQSVTAVAAMFRQIASRLDADWIQRVITELPAQTDWHEKALYSLSYNLRASISRMVENIIRASAQHHRANSAKQLAALHQQLQPYLTMKDKLKQGGAADFAMLTVLVDELARVG